MKFLSLRPSEAEFFFCHANGSPLTRYQFSAVLFKAIHAAGLPVSRFRTHSFRIGCATTLASQGVSIEVIKKFGRWQSDTVNRYIRI